MKPLPIAEPLALADFRNPPSRSRIAPFWFWNTAMSEELVVRQIEQMAAAGVGGFFLHPRQGLTLPYLSKGYFERVKVAVETAQKCGMEAWLYDEYPYPSGIAGGILTANHPEFRARVLGWETADISGETLSRHEFPLGRLVCALACPLENGQVAWDKARDVRAEFGVVLTRELFWLWPMAHIPYNEKRFMADEGRLVMEWTPPAGEQWRVFTAIETEQRGFKYYDCFVDPLCVGAAQEFIRLTHEGYARAVGEHFGQTIPGIFTDEIEPPAWSPEIERELEKSGWDLSQALPALKWDDHPRASELRYAFKKCGLKLFAERWETPIADWCRAHNLIWAAEKPTARPAQFASIAQPSTDAGHRRVDLPPEMLGGGDLRANHRAAIAAAEHNFGEEVRCECFHSLGWGATLQDQKWSMDWMCVQGTNRFTPHAFYATSSGLAKHDAAPSFFTGNPYWKHFRHLGDYAGRLGLAMSTGREVARIALLHPTESMWVRDAQSPGVRREYEWLMNALLAEHHMFHPVDALDLARATATNGALELGHARYETLLIPPLGAVNDETNTAIRAALDAGLHVLMATPLSDGAREMFDWPGVECVGNRENWPQKLEIGRALSIHDSNGAQIPSIWSLWREAGAQQLLFICNTAPNAVQAQIQIEAGVGGWSNWNLETGAKVPVQAQIEVQTSKVTLDLPGFGSALLVSRDNVVDFAPQSTTPVTVLDTAGKWEFRIDSPNALRLNQWKIAASDEDGAALSVDDSDWDATPALPLRFLDQTKKKWVEACPHDGGKSVWYRRAVECEFVPEDLQILVENGAILGDWTLFVNEREVPKSAFVPASYHGDDKIAAPIADFFQNGANLIAIRVENAPEMGGLRTPLHLTGSFALGGAGSRTLVALPKQANFGDLVAAGLPHFSGEATYSRTVSSADLGQIIALPPGFEEIAELRIDGESLGVRPWSPYNWQTQPQIAPSVHFEILVTNTLLPFIEGQLWDAPAQKLRRV